MRVFCDVHVATFFETLWSFSRVNYSLKLYYQNYRRKTIALFD